MSANYNKAGLFVLLFCVFASFIWFMWVVLSASSVDLGEVQKEDLAKAPGPAQAAPPANYWLPQPQLITQGQKMYQTYCAVCHGPKGLGDGLAGKGLTPPPRNLVKGEWKKGGSSRSLYQTLTHGIEGSSMAGFSYLSKPDRWALVHYVRSITKNKVKDNVKELENFAKSAP